MGTEVCCTGEQDGDSVAVSQGLVLPVGQRGGEVPSSWQIEKGRQWCGSLFDQSCRAWGLLLRGQSRLLWVSY